LEDFLQPLIRRHARQLQVPIIVDMDEIPRSTSNGSGQKVVYCGTLSEWKDGVLTLVRAFAQVAAELPEARLYMVGGTVVKGNKEQLLETIREAGLQDRVILTGFVSRGELLEHLSTAHVLALAKPSGLQAENCFPSKIAEYLATGNPVVTTKVGEIPRYLTDGRTAFLAETDNPDSFAEKLTEALTKRDIALRIGEAGREIARCHFDYRIQARRILEFVRELKNNA
ncbi:glycosyltransferase family 4 protein, partial [bacterium]|nr:glycosyltransferase family 4 protein [bacterium]